MLAGLWHWTAGVFSRIGDVSVYWLVLALALKTAESALIGLTWRNILDAAYPKAKVPFKTAWGASQGGTAINALTPAQAGTATMIGIFRTSIPGSSVLRCRRGDRRADALLHRRQRPDVDRSGDLRAAHGVEGLARRRVRDLLRFALGSRSGSRGRAARHAASGTSSSASS